MYDLAHSINQFRCKIQGGNSIMKKLLAMLLCVIMMVTMVPAMAEGADADIVIIGAAAPASLPLSKPLKTVPKRLSSSK